MNTRLALIAATLVSAAGLARAQIQYSSGFLHTPLGSATLSPPSERRVPVRNIGSSGQDGVEIKFRTVRGASVDIDVSELIPLSTAGVSGEIKIKHKGWDGLIYGTHRVSSSSTPGQLHEQFDFSELGYSGVYVVCYSVDGSVWQQAFESSPVVSCTTTIPYGPGEPATWSMGAGKASFSDLSFTMHRNTGRPATLVFDPPVAGSPPVVVSNVVAVACRPICIVAPCPGDWTNLDSMVITGSGVSGIACDRARLGYAQPQARTRQGMSEYGSGSARLTEPPIGDLDGDGLPDLVVVASNIGSSGEDGVVTEFPEGVASVGRKWGNGHVTLMKFTEDDGSEARFTCVKDNSGACSSSFTPDFSGMGSDGCIVECLDGSDNVIYSGTMGPGETATVPVCATITSTLTYTAATPGSGSSMKVAFQDFHFCSFSSGVIVPGVKTIRIRESPTLASTGQPIRAGKTRKVTKCTISSRCCGEDIILGDYRVIPAGSPCVSDCDDGTGTGTPDGGTGIEDLLYYLLRFEAGC